MKTKQPINPPPGSDDAIKLGCLCPVLDNAHGKGAYIIDGEPVYWITAECPVHSEDCTIQDCRLVKTIYSRKE